MPRISKPTRKNRGLTLIEVLIGIFMISIITFAVLGVLGASEKVNRQAEVRSAATAVARQQLDSLISQNGLNRRAVTDQPFTIPASVQALMPPDSAGQRLQGAYSVAPVNGNPNLQQISVRVWWKNSTSRANTPPTSDVRLSAIVASAVDLAGRESGNTRDEIFLPPPPPPPPPPPVPLSTGGNSGGSDGGNTGGNNGGSSGGEPDENGNSGGGSNGGSNGGSSGGTSGGTTGFNFNLYGGQWR